MVTVFYTKGVAALGPITDHASIAATVSDNLAKHTNVASGASYDTPAGSTVVALDLRIKQHQQQAALRSMHQRAASSLAGDQGQILGREEQLVGGSSFHTTTCHRRVACPSIRQFPGHTFHHPQAGVVHASSVHGSGGAALSLS